MQKSFLKLLTLIPFSIVGLTAMEKIEKDSPLTSFTVYNATQYPVDIFIPYTNAEYENGSVDAEAKSIITIAPDKQELVTMNAKASFFYLNVLFHPKAMKQSFYEDPSKIQNGASYVLNIYCKKTGKIFTESVLDLFEYDWYAKLTKIKK